MPVSLYFNLKHQNVYSYTPLFSKFVQINCPDISTSDSQFPDKNNLFACLQFTPNHPNSPQLNLNSPQILPIHPNSPQFPPIPPNPPPILPNSSNSQIHPNSTQFNKIQPMQPLQSIHPFQPIKPNST